MESFLHRFMIGVGFILLTASVSIYAQVEGTYVLEDSEESRFKWKQPELTIKASDDGEYSAVLTESSGEVLLQSKEVEVDGQEFNAIFTLSSDLGDLEISYAGRVDSGTLSGTIVESMFGTEVKLVGKLKNGDEPSHPEEDQIGSDNESEVSVSSESQSINPNIVGTYILDSKSFSRKPELTIKLDTDGEYSATLEAHKVTETEDVEGENNEFSATFTISTNLGDMDITYAGQVQKDRLSGTITESMFGTEVELTGKLKKEVKTNTTLDSD
ncbi:MAG: hypothetical protein OXH31_05435 [Gammaproteobacteria bacterium]|nr:hypothetical protein [Gammaproteobacteria bacterium]